jgi:hypothetical protein
MTWSAAAADSVIRERTSIPRHLLVPDRRVDGFPQIVELISKRRLITLAQDAKVVKPLSAHRRLSILIAAVLLLALGAVTALLKAFTATLEGVSPLIPVAGAALAALLFLSREVSIPLTGSRREAEKKELLEALDKAAAEHSQQWNSLVETLSAEVARTKRDRAVIVDDFDRLDPVSRETLRHYLTHPSRSLTSHEVWIVFEDAGVASLSKEVTLSRGRGPRLRPVQMKVLTQATLDESAKTRLAAEVGRPERAFYRSVKWITGEDADAAEAYAKLLDGQYSEQDFDVRAYGPLEIAYLLSVQQRTGAWGFRERDLVSDLSSKTATAHSEVLRLLLPNASFNRSEVRDAIFHLTTDLKQILNADCLASGEIELVTEAAEVLIERRSRYKLPANEVVHLFWALYWYSKLRGAANVDAYRLRKLARHLVLAAAPGALEVKVSAEVETRFREALTWTARALLAASMPEYLLQLLRRAESETEALEERARLRSVCWQAYTVLGEEDLLAIILSLHPDAVGAPPPATDPESLFIESLRFTDVAPAPAPRGELLGRLLTLDREIMSYAQVRGLWLALTLDPVIGREWSRFGEVSLGAASLAETLVWQGLEALKDISRPRTSVTAMTVSLGIWCYSLGVLRGVPSLTDANDLLDAVRLGSAQMHASLDEERWLGRSEDYVLRALAEELDVVAGAAALVLARGRFDAEPSEDDRARLWDHISDGSGTRAPDQVDRIARRMTLQALTWRTLGTTTAKPLGFEQPAAFMSLRRAHLTFLAGGRRETVRDALSELAGQLDEPGSIGLLAHALVTRRSPSREIAAHLLVRATVLGLRSGFGSKLEADLCLAAASVCHSFSSVEKQELAERLLAADQESGRPQLRSQVGALDPIVRPLIALYLLNVADDVATAAEQGLIAETEVVRDQTEDDQVKDEIQEVLDLYELKRLERAGEGIGGAEILNRWERRRDGTHYAWMLHLLNRRSSVEPEALQAAASFLAEQSAPPELSTPILLAMDLAKHGNGAEPPVEGGSQAIALGYLDEFHPSMEQALPIEVNIDILVLLLRATIGDSGRHRDSLVEWEAARQERDGLGRLQELADSERFFLVLWHYYETLYFFGLRTEPEMDIEELLVEEGGARILAQWRAEGEPVPDPVVQRQTGVRISADFLRYGRALFNEEAEYSELDDARAMFNDASADAVPAILDHLISLESLPERMRAVLTDHKAQLARPR